MVALIVYIAAIAVAYVWIAADHGTEEVFVVYGRAFPVALQMRAWAVLRDLGVRLVLLIAIVFVACFMALSVPLPLISCVPVVILRVAMLSVALCVLPFTRLMPVWRRRQAVLRTLTRLTPFAEGLSNGDISEQHQPADYQVDEEWTAWHPKTELWREASTDAYWWNGIVIVPVLYASKPDPRQLVFPFDFRTFLVWNGPLVIPEGACTLPFTGPGGTRFRYRSQRQCKKMEMWWLLQADMVDLED